MIVPLTFAPLRLFFISEAPRAMMKCACACCVILFGEPPLKGEHTIRLLIWVLQIPMFRLDFRARCQTCLCQCTHLEPKQREDADQHGICWLQACPRSANASVVHTPHGSASTKASIFSKYTTRQSVMLAWLTCVSHVLAYRQ